MLKEIHEQPRAIADTLRARLLLETHDADLEGFEVDTRALRRVVLLACGTSYHAGLVGKFLIEGAARIPCEVDLASEFRYRDPVVGPGDLVIAISQSGETADTLAAVKEARARGCRVLAISNVVDSAIPRASHGALYTHAGPEIGVASTKCFTAQLAALSLVAIHLGRRTGTLAARRGRQADHRAGRDPAQDGRDAGGARRHARSSRRPTRTRATSCSSGAGPTTRSRSRARSSSRRSPTSTPRATPPAR